MLYSKEKTVKISAHKFYLRNGVLTRIIRVSPKYNAVTIFRYDTFVEEVIEYDTAAFGLVAVFRIGEVAKMIDRKPDTLRKYERRGLIPPPKKFSLTEDGSVTMRVYTESDLADLIKFFAERGVSSKKYSAVNQKNVVEGLKTRFNKIKNVGGKNV